MSLLNLLTETFIGRSARSCSRRKSLRRKRPTVFLFVELLEHRICLSTIGYWRFEEGFGVTANDNSPNHNMAALLNSAAFRTYIPESPIPQTGTPNTFSIQFDGVDDQLQAATSPSLDITGPFTIEAYVKPTGQMPAGAGVVTKSNASGTSPAYGLFFDIDNQVRFQVFTQDIGVFSPAPTTALPVDRWSHVAGTYDGATLTVYLNGIEQSSINIRGSGLLETTTAPLLIGFSGGNFQEPFSGFLDEVRISNQPLLPSQFLNSTPGLPNDNFSNRIGVTGTSATVMGTNVDATKENGEPRHGGDRGGKSVWWTWTAESSGTVRIDTMGSDFTAVLGVYTGDSVTSLTPVRRIGGILTTFARQVSFDVVAGRMYQIAVDGRRGASGNITLNIRLPLDPDDQIIEAAAIGALEEPRSRGASIDSRTDVDMFSFTVTAGQRVAFDVDRRTGNLDSYLRLFDANGQPLVANDNGPAPRELSGRLVHEAYLEHRFLQAGTYFVGVSGMPNTVYDAVAGWGDVGGVTAGAYTLTLTPLTQFAVDPLAGANRIEGHVFIPNASGRRPGIEVYLQFVNANGSPSGGIQNRLTWLVVHGRASSEVDFRPLAGSIDRHSPDDQVLVLDWREGAHDNHYPTFLDGAIWIPFVSQWAADALDTIGVRTSSLFLVGHSWGSFVTFEVAKSLKSVQNIPVRAIVALDPAGGAINYNDRGVNFRSVSQMSWAFNGNGSFGSITVSATAHEAFTIRNSLGAVQAHGAPIGIFRHLVEQNNSGAATPPASLFRLDRLVSGTAGPWLSDRYRNSSTLWRQRVFEGEFSLTDPNRDGVWTDAFVESLRYTRLDGAEETLTARAV